MLNLEKMVIIILKKLTKTIGYVYPPYLKKQENHVNFFMLPFENNEYKTLIRILRNSVFSMPKKAWAKTLSEKDW